MYNLILGDVYDKISMIPDYSIDHVVCDLPYNVTAQDWDCLIDIKFIWDQLQNKLSKNNSHNIIFFASEPLSSSLIGDFKSFFRRDMIWVKQATNFVNANSTVMRQHEDILWFNIGNGIFNPLKIPTPKTRNAIRWSTNRNSTVYGQINPSNRGISNFRYQGSVFDIVSDPNIHRVHPNQKPLELMSRLILMFTNVDDTVLDFCMGSGSTGVACMTHGRHFIGIEKNDKYFNIAQTRILEEYNRKKSGNSFF